METDGRLLWQMPEQKELGWSLQLGVFLIYLYMQTRPLSSTVLEAWKYVLQLQNSKNWKYFNMKLIHRCVSIRQELRFALLFQQEIKYILSQTSNLQMYSVSNAV